MCRAGASFSVTVRMDPKVEAAIAAIGEDGWTAICYPRAIWDDQLACWVSDLLRAAGSLASLACAKARGATLSRDLIDVAARTARTARGHLTLHLPDGWHRQAEWLSLFEAACDPPARIA